MRQQTKLVRALEYFVQSTKIGFIQPNFHVYSRKQLYIKIELRYRILFRKLLFETSEARFHECRIFAGSRD